MRDIISATVYCSWSLEEKMGYSLALWYMSVLSLALRVYMGDGEQQLSAKNSTASTICGPSMECANLQRNISYPFWDSAACAASPSYVLSNCSSSSAHARWDPLSLALQAAVPGEAPRPAVITDITLSGRDYNTSNGYINLTWDSSLLDMDVCASIFSPHNLSEYNIPASVNLTGFANNSFEFSRISGYDNVYLFFNCTNKTAVSEYVKSSTTWEQESQICHSQKALCPSRLSATSCISLTPSKELLLQHVMDTLVCSHFTFGIATSTAIVDQNQYFVPSFLSTGLVRLSWNDSECTGCQHVGGHCVYDEYRTGKLSDCECGQETIDFRTQSCPLQDAHYHEFKCYHDGVLNCNPTLQICIGIVLSVVAVLVAFLCFCCFKKGFHDLSSLKKGFGKIKKGFHDDLSSLKEGFGKIKKGFLDYSSVLVRLAISALKVVLRRLQATTYRPDLSMVLKNLEGLTERPVEYSYSSIASATKSFSHVVGEGGFGVVYKGTLPQSQKDGAGTQIAVKVLEMSSKMKKQLLNEVGTIGRIHHVNVVRLLGFCVTEDHEMLVYEYVTNGSLDRWLFAGKDDGQGDQERMLDWSQRYAIAVGVARGLSYLHEECRHRTIHCDIKPQNILLDEAMTPKIADFGLSRLMGRDESQVVTLARGTPGYMAPEFWRGGESRLSTKFDVYSYGMVLLELISGRRNFAYDDAVGSMCCFPAVAFEAAMQSNVGAILDARLASKMQASVEYEHDEAQWNQIWTAAFVALWCIQDHPASRPSMSEVVQYLEGTVAISKTPPQPSISTTSSGSPFSIITASQDRQDFTSISGGR